MTNACLFSFQGHHKATSYGQTQCGVSLGGLECGQLQKQSRTNDEMVDALQLRRHSTRDQNCCGFKILQIRASRVRPFFSLPKAPLPTYTSPGTIEPDLERSYIVSLLRSLSRLVEGYCSKYSHAKRNLAKCTTTLKTIFRCALPANRPPHDLYPAHQTIPRAGGEHHNKTTSKFETRCSPHSANHCALPLPRFIEP